MPGGRRSAWAGAVVGSVLLLGACSAGGSPDASTPATDDVVDEATAELDGRLFYSVAEEGDVQSLLLREGGDESVVVEPGVACCVFRISPSGEEVLVLPNSSNHPLVGATVPLTGGDPVPLPELDPTLNGVASAYSPDGTRIAYEGWDDGDPARTGIYTAVAADSTDLVRVTTHEGAGHDVPLDYSPDGSQLLFFRATHDDPDYTDGSLWTVDVDGSGATQLTPDDVRPNWWARWSPDGSRIVFGAERLADSGPIWTIAPDGSDLAVVYEDADGGFAITPAWSPDGSQIVFALDPDNDEYAHPANEVYVIPAEGGEPELVIGGDAFKRWFTWVD
ncbi:hypothetical protein GB864_09070 [Agromyces sp. MMS17-SY077]|uniref:WD40-like Beta Propeller Repeat n=2 Tax=Agromyces seonyuensis TaxID=2662446 RepID=A0A6I4NWN4_9MICO|nr:hypothetical protein [Agromyces seonyuensis]